MQCEPISTRFNAMWLNAMKKYDALQFTMVQIVQFTFISLVQKDSKSQINLSAFWLQT